MLENINKFKQNKNKTFHETLVFKALIVGEENNIKKFFSCLCDKAFRRLHFDVSFKGMHITQ